MKLHDAVLIANGQGFWGDSLLGPIRLVREGPLDYLTLDYLAEVTMSIMQKQRARNPEAGYASDFVRMIDRVAPELVQKNIQVVANAGGVNPQACAKAVLSVLARHGIKGVKIGVVEGDDILGQLDALIAEGETLANMDTGAALSSVRASVSSANVYLGAFPIAEALGQGAQIVITGRGTDPGLVLGPMIHEFGWQRVPDMAKIGYPIVEAYHDGSFVITKHAGTGGVIDLSTVGHQLAYEMGDPKAYLGPDCSADFTSFRMRQDGPDRVRVEGVRGQAPTPTYKVSISFENGWKAVGQLTISGPDALAKARLCAEIVWKRLELDGCVFAPEERMVEYLGANVCHAGIGSAERADPGEIVLRMGVKGMNKAKIERFGYELVPLVTSGPPGVTGFAGGRPHAQEIIGFWPALVKKTRIQSKVSIFES